MIVVESESRFRGEPVTLDSQYPDYGGHPTDLLAGERGAEVRLAMTSRYDRNHRATLEDDAGFSVVVLAASDQPTRHRERLLARSVRAVVHPGVPLVHARPGAAARAGSRSSPGLHAKQSHVTAPPQEPFPGSAGCVR